LIRSLPAIIGAVFSAAVLIASGAAWIASEQAPHPVWFRDMLSLILGLAFFVGALALFLTFYSAYLYRRTASLSVSNEELIRMAERMQDRCEELETQVELLSAVRDISSIVNDQTLFKEALERIARVLTRHVGCEEIVLFVSDPATGELAPRMHFTEGKARFDGKIKPGLVDNSNIGEAFDHGRIFTVVEDGVLSFSLPLVSERERIGVVKVFFDLPEDTKDRMASIEKKEYLVKNVARHLALPVKTSHLYDQATIDGLTGLYTKRHLLNRLSDAVRRARLENKSLAFVMMDIDHFKSVNDTYGHQFGDFVLQGIAERIQKTIRSADSAYRYGGEELCVLLENTEPKKAAEIAERLRKKMESRRFKDGDISLKVTASLGVAELSPAVRRPEDLIARADKALYCSKESGRNRVTIWSKKLELEAGTEAEVETA